MSDLTLRSAGLAVAWLHWLWGELESRAQVKASGGEGEEVTEEADDWQVDSQCESVWTACWMFPVSIELPSLFGCTPSVR